MSVTDLTSMAESQLGSKEEINERLMKIRDEVADSCYQCAKCTSGCEAHKLLELEPHRIVALLKRGLVDELVNSDVIWTCMSCFKCRERCPQNVSPVDILFCLKNMAVAGGQQVPGAYTAWLQSIMTIGLLQDVQEITLKDGKVVKRGDLPLPELSGPEDAAAFQAAFAGVAMEMM